MTIGGWGEKDRDEDPECGLAGAPSVIRRELRRIRLADWDEAAPRLGLVVRPWRPDRVGVALSSTIMVAVVVEVGPGLVVVGRQLVRGWSRPIGALVAAALDRSRPMPGRTIVEVTAGGGAPVEVTVWIGDVSTAATVVDLGRLPAAMGPGGAIAVRLGDRALATVALRTRSRDERIGALDAAVSLAAGLEGAGPAMACQLDGGLTIFEPGTRPFGGRSIAALPERFPE